MAANNYYGIPVHGQAASYTAAATGYPAAPTGYTAVGTAAAASAAYAQRIQSNAAAAAAYSAYPQTAPTYAAASAAPIVAAAANTAYAYPQYATTAQHLTTAAQHQVAAAAAAAAAVPASVYYPQPSIASVTYSTIDNAYQTRPIYSQTHAQLAAVAARPTMAATAAAAVATTRPLTSYHLPVAAAAGTYTSAYTYAASTPTNSYTYQPAAAAAHLPTSVTAAAAASAAAMAAKPNIYVQPQQAATINLTPVQMAPAPKVGTWRAVKPVPTAAAAVAAQAVSAAVAATASNVRSFKGPRIPPKPQQLHYCEVCKISCAGPQTYKEHLEGQKHKKKEASMKTGAATQSSAPTTRGGNALRCELCDVTCTGSDAYAAHIRGAKHQKVVKLHTKLGKPIPSVDPVLVTAGSGGGSTTGAAASATSSMATGQSIASLAKPAMYGQSQPRQPAVPKITFVGADKIKTEKTASVATSAAASSFAKAGYNEQEVTIPRLPEEKDVQPVGHDYIEEMKSDDGKVVSFNCKLCECRFNDPNAKEMHMKGRRHRLQYKKKVDPDLVVDIKPSLRQRKIQEERQKRSLAREEFWKRREEEFRLMEEEERIYWAERRRFEEEIDDMNFYRRFPGGVGRGGGLHPPGLMSGRFGPPPPGMGHSGPPPLFGGPPHHHPYMMRRPDTLEDRHCMAKHEAIYPAEAELEAIQSLVAHSESALKKVSDHLAAQDSGNVDRKPTGLVSTTTTNNKTIKNEEEKEGGSSTAAGGDGKTRILVGVMRVGLLAKQLLLKGDTNVNLVVLCGEKPTKSLLERMAMNLPLQLAAIAPEEKYEVRRDIQAASLIVATPETKKPRLSVTITLTSPIMRETAEEAATRADPPDVLDHVKCLEALAELRHVKWFHSRALNRHSCTVVIRILRDLCQRNPTWTPLKCWALELLVEKVLNSAGCPLSPGDALRRVFEALAGGILLPDSPGFLDPCEKEPMDAAYELSNQEREDITSSSQHALRLIAFRQMYKVLGMEPLPPPKQWRLARKRRRDSAEPEDLAEEKKDKKEPA